MATKQLGAWAEVCEALETQLSPEQAAAAQARASARLEKALSAELQEGSALHAVCGELVVFKRSAEVRRLLYRKVYSQLAGQLKQHEQPFLSLTLRRALRRLERQSRVSMSCAVE